MNWADFVLAVLTSAVGASAEVEGGRLPWARCGTDGEHALDDSAAALAHRHHEKTTFQQLPLLDARIDTGEIHARGRGNRPHGPGLT